MRCETCGNQMVASLGASVPICPSCEPASAVTPPEPEYEVTTSEVPDDEDDDGGVSEE